MWGATIPQCSDRQRKVSMIWAAAVGHLGSLDRAIPRAGMSPWCHNGTARSTTVRIRLDPYARLSLEGDPFPPVAGHSHYIVDPVMVERIDWVAARLT